MQPLMEAGLESLGAVELRTSLEAAFSMELPATVTFDYPSISALAKYIAGQQRQVSFCQRPQKIWGFILLSGPVLISDIYMQTLWIWQDQQGAGLWQPQMAVACRSTLLAGTACEIVTNCTADVAAEIMWQHVQVQPQHAREIPAAKAAQSEASLVAKIGAIVQQMLGSSVDANQPLMEAGLDSLGAVELRTKLGAEFGMELPATVTFDHPSVAALAKFLAGQDAPDHTQVQKTTHFSF